MKDSWNKIHSSAHMHLPAFEVDGNSVWMGVKGVVNTRQST
jgi:hypothetical protein